MLAGCTVTVFYTNVDSIKWRTAICTSIVRKCQIWAINVLYAWTYAEFSNCSSVDVGGCVITNAMPYDHLWPCALQRSHPKIAVRIINGKLISNSLRIVNNWWMYWWRWVDRLLTSLFVFRWPQYLLLNNKIFPSLSPSMSNAPFQIYYFKQLWKIKVFTFKITIFNDQTITVGIFNQIQLMDSVKSNSIHSIPVCV